MASDISTPAVRTILCLAFLLASFTRPDLFWVGLLALVFLVAMPLSLAMYLIGLLALEFLSAWTANPACDPTERHVLRTFYWGALPGMVAHSVASIVVVRRGHAGPSGPLYWALGVAVLCGGVYAGRRGGFREEEWEYLRGALWLWTGRLVRWSGIVWEDGVYPQLNKIGLYDKKANGIVVEE